MSPILTLREVWDLRDKLFGLGTNYGPQSGTSGTSRMGLPACSAAWHSVLHAAHSARGTVNLSTRAVPHVPLGTQCHAPPILPAGQSI
eukprot:364364-Chlamydomonas_euryale.AAC.7